MRTYNYYLRITFNINGSVRSSNFHTRSERKINNFKVVEQVRERIEAQLSEKYGAAVTVIIDNIMYLGRRRDTYYSENE